MQKPKVIAKFGDYYLCKLLKEGTSGRVYLGFHKDKQDQMVAIKILFPHSSNQKRIQRQLKALQELKHENIIKMLDKTISFIHNKKGKTYYDKKQQGIILQYIQKDLQDKSEQFNEGFPIEITKMIFRQLISAVKCMHDQNYIHRDIKTTNIMITQKYEIKLIDFGCSKRCHDKNEILTQYGEFTKGCDAPEISKVAYNGFKADIFSMGVVLFILHLNRIPFDSSTSQDKYYHFLINKKQYFWKFFSDSTRKKISPAFKDLFQKMVCQESRRISIQEIEKHPWFKETYEETLKQQASDVIKLIKKQNQIKQQNIEAISQQTRLSGGMNSNFKQYYQQNVESHIQPRKFQEDKEQFMNKNSFEINQGFIYAYTYLQIFIESAQFPLTSFPNSDLYNNIPFFKLKEPLTKKKSSIIANFKYFQTIEYQQEEKQQFKDYHIEMQIQFCENSQEQLFICMHLIKGNEFNFKKICKEIKKQFTYCLKSR